MDYWGNWRTPAPGVPICGVKVDSLAAGHRTEWLGYSPPLAILHGDSAVCDVRITSFQPVTQHITGKAGSLWAETAQNICLFGTNSAAFCAPGNLPKTGFPCKLI